MRLVLRHMDYIDFWPIPLESFGSLGLQNLSESPHDLRNNNVFVNVYQSVSMSCEYGIFNIILFVFYFRITK
jgi:hypothetical protein